jgi:predicted O-methyltransferase YrrM
MSNDIDIVALKARYLSVIAARRREPKFLDRSLAAEGARWIVDYVIAQKPAVVLELGSGFSTLALGLACSRSEASIRLLSADHSGPWMEDVKAVGLAIAREQRKRTGRGAQQPEWCSLGRLRSDEGHLGLVGKCAFVLVDHGPAMKTRLDDLPWIASLVAENGIMALDDCRSVSPNATARRYEEDARGVLAGLGWSLERAFGSGNGDKWIGVARRRLG